MESRKIAPYRIVGLILLIIVVSPLVYSFSVRKYKEWNWEKYVCPGMSDYEIKQFLHKIEYSISIRTGFSGPHNYCIYRIPDGRYLHVYFKDFDTKEGVSYPGLERYEIKDKGWEDYFEKLKKNSNK